MVDLMELRNQDIVHLREWNWLMQCPHLARSLRSFTVPASMRDETAGSQTLAPVSWMLWVSGQVQLACQQVVNLQLSQSTIPSEMKQREESPKEKRMTTVWCSFLPLRQCLYPPPTRVEWWFKNRGAPQTLRKGRSREQRHNHFTFRQPNEEAVYLNLISTAIYMTARVYISGFFTVNKTTRTFQEMLMMEPMISMTLTLNLPKIQAKGPCITTAYILYVCWPHGALLGSPHLCSTQPVSHTHLFKASSLACYQMDSVIKLLLSTWSLPDSSTLSSHARLSSTTCWLAFCLLTVITSAFCPQPQVLLLASWFHFDCLWGCVNFQYIFLCLLQKGLHHLCPRNFCNIIGSHTHPLQYVRWWFLEQKVSFWDFFNNKP